MSMHLEIKGHNYGTINMNGSRSRANTDIRDWGVDGVKEFVFAIYGNELGEKYFTLLRNRYVTSGWALLKQDVEKLVKIGINKQHAEILIESIKNADANKPLNVYLQESYNAKAANTSVLQKLEQIEADVQELSNKETRILHAVTTLDK